MTERNSTIGKSTIGRIRQDFPILHQKVRGKPLAYLDNAATSQKPKQVIEALSRYYGVENSNIHRGVYYLSEQATAAYEAARVKAQRFLNAGSPSEVIFVRGTTEAINLVASSYGRLLLEPGDEVVISGMEHHSNIVPWQMLCESVGAKLCVAPIDDSGSLIVSEYEKLLGPRTKAVALVHVSNSLGTINDVKYLVGLAKKKSAVVLIDGAQAAPHMPIDVQDIGCDFYTISGHKMYGPTGIGVLYGRLELLEAMPPYQGGGEMIRSVTFEKTIYAPPPAKFEAGTPHIAGAIGMGVAIDYLQQLGWDFVHEREELLLRYALERLETVPGIRIIGSATSRASVVSFTLDGIHAHDIGTIVDQEGVAIRTGHHCTQPVMDFFGVPATARASFAFYNTAEEVDILVNALMEAREVFGR
ncbi:MAG: cysteine desulfurase [Gemmatimonadota bacterium]|nr:MAG: cysteine desulfurase [Gemmatimonadota bacterium]